MMVYIVIFKAEGEDLIEGVFATKLLAEKYIETGEFKYTYLKGDSERIRLEEHDVIVGCYDGT